jgi:hypothetical protein
MNNPVILNKEMKQLHTLKVIRNLNYKLMQVEMRIRYGANGIELQRLEQTRFRYETRLMQLYGTEKYGIVAN